MSYSIDIGIVFLNFISILTSIMISIRPVFAYMFAIIIPPFKFI